jgi:Protein of unknown function (DUF3551)
VTRFVLAIPLLAIVLVTMPSKAQTYDPKYPVCMHVYGELLGERMDCIFASLAQCQASATGLPATCLINPNFVQGARVGADRWRRRRDSNPR